MFATTTTHQHPVRARTAVLAVFTLNGFLFANWVARVPAVRDGLDLSAGALGLLLLAMSTGAVLALPLVGAVVMRVGSRRTVRAAGLLAAASLVVAAAGVSTGSLPIAALGLFGLGVGTGAWDVGMNIEGAAVERELGFTVMPQFHAAFSLGAVVGAATGALAAVLDLALLAHLTAISAFVAIGVVAAVRRFLPDDVVAHDAAPSARSRAGNAFGAWLEPRTLLIGVLVLAAALTEGSANDWLAIAVVDGYGGSPALGAVTFALFVAAMTAVRLGGNGLLDKYGRVAVLRTSAAVSLVGLLMFGLAPSFGIGLVGVIAWGAGAALAFPVGISAAADDPIRAAARVSVVSSIGYCAFLAGPPLLGLVADQIGIRHTLLVVGIGLLVSIAVSRAAARLPGRVEPGADEAPAAELALAARD